MNAGQTVSAGAPEWALPTHCDSGDFRVLSEIPRGNECCKSSCKNGPRSTASISRHRRLDDERPDPDRSVSPNASRLCRRRPEPMPNDCRGLRAARILRPRLNLASSRPQRHRVDPGLRSPKAALVEIQRISFLSAPENFPVFSPESRCANALAKLLPKQAFCAPSYQSSTHLSKNASRSDRQV